MLRDFESMAPLICWVRFKVGPNAGLKILNALTYNVRHPWPAALVLSQERRGADLHVCYFTYFLLQHKHLDFFWGGALKISPYNSFCEKLCNSVRTRSQLRPVAIPPTQRNVTLLQLKQRSLQESLLHPITTTN